MGVEALREALSRTTPAIELTNGDARAIKASDFFHTAPSSIERKLQDAPASSTRTSVENFLEDLRTFLGEGRPLFKDVTDFIKRQDASIRAADSEGTEAVMTFAGDTVKVASTSPRVTLAAVYLLRYCAFDHKDFQGDIVLLGAELVLALMFKYPNAEEALYDNAVNALYADVKDQLSKGGIDVEAPSVWANRSLRLQAGSLDVQTKADENHRRAVFTVVEAVGALTLAVTVAATTMTKGPQLVGSARVATMCAWAAVLLYVTARMWKIRLDA